MGKIILKPQPGPQEAFLACSADVCIYGGAAGGGKTYGLLMTPLRYKNVKRFGAVMFRRNFNQIFSEGGMWDEASNMYYGIRGAVRVNSRSKWMFCDENDRKVSQISFAHIDRDDGVHAWQGSQIAMIGFDELCHFSEYVFFYMLSRNRSVCVGAVVKVLKFDAKKMTVNVQPLSKHLENGSYESQPPILQIPVAVTRSGGFIFRPWYKPGDVGVVLYLDHDMDATVTGGKEATPLTERNHAPTDAVFVGALVAGEYQVPDSIPNESIALAKDDGSIYIALKKDGIEIKGDITLKGNITQDGDTVASGVSLVHHTHPGDSGGTTGSPS